MTDPMTRVLIVDDDADARRALRRFAESTDRVFDEAGSADHALALVRRLGPPAVAVCDIRMPGKDGLWLVDQFRVQWPDVVVVIASAIEEFPVAITCLRKGIADWIPKPFTHDQVQHSIGRAATAYRSKQRASGKSHHAHPFEFDINLWAGIDAVLSIVDARDPTCADRARRRARLAVNVGLTLGLTEPSITDIEHAVVLREIARGSGMEYAPADALRFAGAVSRIPVFAKAGSILTAVYAGRLANGASVSEVGVSIVEMVARYDHMTATSSTSVPLEKAFARLQRGSSETDQMVLNACRALACNPEGVDATFASWLDGARQRLNDARYTGDSGVIEAARAAHDEVWDCIQDAKQARPKLGPGAPSSPPPSKSK